MTVALGVFLWTLVEYLLHRFAFHRYAKWTHSYHPRHHAAPRDIQFLFATPVWVAGGSAIGFAIFFLVMGSATEALKLLAGFLAGYAYYEFVHYRIHFRAGETWLLRKQRSAHFQHHFYDPTRRFGVTTPLWDWVFRTL